MGDLLSDLNEFEKSLNHAENDLTTVESTSSIVDNLVSFKSIEKFVGLIPESVLVHHYVYFRMTLRRYANEFNICII